MAQKQLADQMAAFNNFDETADSTSFASNSLLNATCPARIQNAGNTSLLSEYGGSSSRGAIRRPKREPFKISPLEQIDEVPPHSSSSSRRHISRYPDSYKTKLCDAFRRQGHCVYNDDCPYAHGTDELRMPPRRRPFIRNIEPLRYRKESPDVSVRVQPHRHQENRKYTSTTMSRQICKNFERGNCRYGPRCKYIHREQMAVYDQNVSLYVPSESPMPFYQNGQCFVPAQPYFVPTYLTNELNQTMPMYAPQPTYYYQPMAPTPVMDQAPTPQPLLLIPELAPPPPLSEPERFPEGFFQKPPPPLMQAQLI
ncbi:unnamed protein product [Caenorhabditis sp. 36 PRJEB53466]|nr:unnamed protein product [Caenorhabditis sp. 36 PRJEB53466]